MSYQLVETIVTPPPDDEVILSGLYEAETEFIIEVYSPEGERKQWLRAGYLARMFEVPGIGQTEGEVIRLKLERRKVSYLPSSEPFRLVFRPVFWLCDYQLKLWVRDVAVLPPTPFTIGGASYTFGGIIYFFG